jgi:hypothetical protein
VCRHCGREQPVKVKPFFPANQNGVSRGQTAAWSLGVFVAVMAILALSIRNDKKASQLQTASNEVIHLAVAKYSPQPTSKLRSLRQNSDSQNHQADRLRDSVGRIVARLQPGQSRQYAYRDDYHALVRYEGRD